MDKVLDTELVPIGPDLRALAMELIVVIRSAITPLNALAPTQELLEQAIAPYNLRIPPRMSPRHPSNDASASTSGQVVGKDEQQLAEARQLIRGYQASAPTGVEKASEEIIASSDAQADQPPDMEAPKTEACAQPAPAKRAMFRWTGDMLSQLTAEFLISSQDASISAIAGAIADRHHWPVKCVEYKIHHLDLPRQREQHPTSMLKAHSAAIAVCASEQETQSEPVAQESSERTLGPLPMELQRGNYVWDGRVDDETQRWYLDYSYGSFPAQIGDHVRYRGRIYVLQQVGTSSFRAEISQPRPAELAQIDMLEVQP